MPNKNIAKLGEGTRFSSTNQPKNKTGRGPSLKRQLRVIALADGKLVFKVSDAIINDDKIIIKVPNEKAMAMRVVNIAARSRNESAALSAIKQYYEIFDDQSSLDSLDDMNDEKKYPTTEEGWAEYLQEKKENLARLERILIDAK